MNSESKSIERFKNPGSVDYQRNVPQPKYTRFENLPSVAETPAREGWLQYRSSQHCLSPTEGCRGRKAEGKQGHRHQ